jgi:hypothetical protein
MSRWDGARGVWLCCALKPAFRGIGVAEGRDGAEAVGSSFSLIVSCAEIIRGHKHIMKKRMEYFKI